MTNATKDRKIVSASYEAEYEAFDQLPTQIKKALWNAPLKLSAIDVLREYQVLVDDYNYSMRAATAQIVKDVMKAGVSS